MSHHGLTGKLGSGIPRNQGEPSNKKRAVDNGGHEKGLAPKFGTNPESAEY
jgi:hypothetical protein